MTAVNILTIIAALSGAISILFFAKPRAAHKKPFNVIAWFLFWGLSAFAVLIAFGQYHAGWVEFLTIFTLAVQLIRNGGNVAKLFAPFVSKKNNVVVTLWTKEKEVK